MKSFLKPHQKKTNTSIAVYHADLDYATDLASRLQHALPQHQIKLWQSGDDARYLLAWLAPDEVFSMPSLQVVFSLGAGVDKLVAQSNLPESAKIVRLEEAGMGDQMLEYALYGILYHSRDFARFKQQQQSKEWRGLATPKHLPFSNRIGVLGLGQLGGYVARRLAELGYPVSGYSTSPKSILGVSCYSGTDKTAFLAESEVLICLLPLTNNTRNSLNAELFSQLPCGAFLINIARGAQLVESDLIAALDSGQLSGALLDVFQTEPLPTDHPFWDDERIVITPHLAAITTKPEAIAQISRNILAYENQQPLTGLVDRVKQY